MEIQLHHRDLPPHVELGATIAIDTETMGLNPKRDRLCLVQLTDGDGICHLIQIDKDQRAAPNLEKQLSDSRKLKIFHFARFDIAALKSGLGIDCAPVYCTKIASKLVRTYTDRHSLKELARELLAIDVSKQEQSSDWGAVTLSDAQKTYAAGDVEHLHALRAKLDRMLEREGRVEIAQACFDFLPVRAQLDLSGWPEKDIFAHA